MSQFQVEKRFGYIAVDKGFINEDQLAEAMEIQIREDLCNKEHRLLGQILLSLSYITREQIDQVLIAMHFPLVFCGNYVGMPPSRLADVKAGTSLLGEDLNVKKSWS